MELKTQCRERFKPAVDVYKRQIYERVWNEKAINTDTIMVHVRNIRDKIEINPREPKYLKFPLTCAKQVKGNKNNINTTQMYFMS